MRKKKEAVVVSHARLLHGIREVQASGRELTVYEATRNDVRNHAAPNIYAYFRYAYRSNAIRLWLLQYGFR